MGNLTLSTFGVLLFSITLGSFGQICLKQGLKHAGHVSLIMSMLTPWVLLGLGLYVISTFTWLLVISRVRLSVAYPMISISYVMVMLLSWLILREKIDWAVAAAALVFIGAGVSFIGLGLGRGPDTNAEGEAN